MNTCTLGAALLAAMSALSSMAPLARGDVAVTVTIDPSAGHVPISPFIYGSNQDIPDAPLTTMRQGGNRLTGYNWENNASNAGNDWNHQSDDYLTWGVPRGQENTPGIVPTHFHEEAQQRGVSYSIVTLQLAGYVAADKAGPVAAAQAAPSSRWVATSLTKPTAYSLTPDTTDAVVYMDEFVNLLVTRYGPASSPTGVRGYCLDNEPDLWSRGLRSNGVPVLLENGTHPLLHPNKPTCVELISKNVDAARMLRRLDPSAETFGFVSYGFGGCLDYQSATDWPTERQKGDYRWFLDYYLDQMKKASDTAGARLLDVVDIHNYSEARESADLDNAVRIQETEDWTNRACNTARMQAPRTYWDSTYREHSWIARWFSQYLPLLPTMQASIDAFYPGTKLALTEYNFGGESHVSGGIAQADTLGIFADQGIYAACWWKIHEDVSYIAAAFRLYLNYDGAGGAVGDTAVSASVNDRTTCSVHASIDADDPTRLHVILLNKNDTEPAVATIGLAGTRRYGSARVFAFDASSAAISERAAVTSIENNTFTYTLPPLTAAHLVLTAADTSLPEISVQPTATTSTAGGQTKLTVTAGGTGLTYQWRLDGVDIAGATGAEYTIPSTQVFHGGSYTVVVTNANGSATSEAAVVTVNPAPDSNARLMNLSTRALDLTGGNALIPGFVISGTGTKRMLIRAVGPGMYDTFELEDRLVDSQLFLRDESNPGEILASNDDWGTASNKADIIATSQEVGAFPLAEGSKDAAMLVDLPPGRYTAIAPGVGDATGIAMVELYDADDAPTATLINISNRGFVDVGHRIMIPGFVVSPEGSRTFLIRAVGPGLATTFPEIIAADTVLQDPVLTVFRGANPILTVDDWSAGSQATTTQAVATQVGAFPLVEGSKDAAFVVTLAPGHYTIQATGKNASTGVALVEVYLVPDRR